MFGLPYLVGYQTKKNFLPSFFFFFVSPAPNHTAQSSSTTTDWLVISDLAEEACVEASACSFVALFRGPFEARLAADVGG